MSAIGLIAGILSGSLSANLAYAQTSNNETASAANSASSEVSIDARMGNEANSKTPQPDLAFGAFQRGMYLTAFELALPRAKLGDPAAQTLIAEMYDKGLGVPRSLKESTAWYALAAENKDLEAQFSYAVKLLEGKYVKADKKRARALMKIAADGGHATAAFNFGQMIMNERPTSSGFKQALPYFEKAANGRVADAYYSLAKLYESGRLNGYPENKLAQEWMLKAARAGIDTAQVELSIWLANGKGGIKTPKVAFQWMQRAAMGGNVIAQSRLAKMYLEPFGVEQNIVEGAKWHIIARRAGLDDPWLNEILSSLDQKDLSAALEAANRWPS
ncbi:MAG: tetratricopeptide repeat protein [Nitratireductor sp.]